MPNRLAKEHSPYLLQHAQNPVDWYPWGSDAFERARREDKPIFLSIGYSTCHWCHVMERESFENEEIARVLNERFVAVKVDREERPDIDRVYMAALQMMTGGGGWPMSMFLTPELTPFYGGTYYPPADQSGYPGFKTVLEHLSRFWMEEKEKALESGRQLVEMLEEERAERVAAPGAEPDPALLDLAFREIASGYDKENAGFGAGAKFPRPSVFTFLFRYYRRTKTSDALEMALATLLAMANGGIYDHLGGGFHRYSVDAEWRVPHFEKMLYDQAQMVRALADAYMITRDDAFARTARETIEYVLRDLRSERGAFFSAEDADSRAVRESAEGEAKEGAFYLWSKSEIESVLTQKEALVACAYYSVEEAGNVKSDPHGEFAGKNILFAPFTVAEVGTRLQMSEEEAEHLLSSAKEKLFRARAERPRPFRDEKVIASWNGLMIGALAHASVVLEEPRYYDEAERAAEVLVETLYQKETKTLHRVLFEAGAGTPGAAAAEAHLDDYACVSEALLELYLARPAGAEAKTWRALAEALTGTQEALFWDAADGGFFETSGKDASVLVRMKDAYDGAEPAGNSVAAMNLLRLARLAPEPSYQQLARRTIRTFCSLVGSFPHAMPLMMSAVDAWLSPGEFVCTPEGCALPEAGA